MHTMRLELATVLRRAQATALIALSCASVAFPAIARADEGSDKGSDKASSSAKSSAKSGSNDSRDERDPSGDHARDHALDAALLPSFDMVSVTGGSSVPIHFDQSHGRRPALFGALASGALIATQFHGSSGASSMPVALTSPSAHTPELGNPHAPIVNPEPGTVALLAAGLGVLAFTGYRRRKGHVQP